MKVTDTAVVSCFYNFHDYSAPKRNLRRWMRYMESQSVPVYGIELIIGDQEGITKDYPGWRQVKVNPEVAMLWQKEASLNLAVKHVPEHYTKIVLCDSDVFFSNPDWYAMTSATLNVVNACQPFQMAQWADNEGHIFQQRVACGFDHMGLLPHHTSHPGFATALTRDFWAEHGPNGIFPFYVLGDGDVALSTALGNIPYQKMKERRFNLGTMRPLYDEWFDKVRAWNTGYSFVPGNCIHEFHGSIKNRFYTERLAWIADIDPQKHLKFNDDGLLEWTEKAPRKMVREVGNYYAMRKEDV